MTKNQFNRYFQSIPSEENNIHIVENFIESITTTFNLPSNLLGRISLAVIEAFNNAVYSNSGDIKKMVTIVAEKVKSQLKVTVRDEGVGFDYKKIPDPTSLENTDKECRSGLFLMKELSDELIFENNGATAIMIFDLKLNRFSKLSDYFKSFRISRLDRKSVV